MQNIVIGIEGMVAAGKTSICRELTKLIPNSIFIDGGEIYRGIVQAIIKSGLDLNNFKRNTPKVNPMDLMKKLEVEFKIEENATQIYIKGKKVEKEEIENPENALGVSIMAKNTNNEDLYNFARKIVDTYREKFNIILSARDIITIYPKMTCHVFITADLKERVKRRYNQYNGKYGIEEIEKMIIQRDKLHEEAGFNKLYEKSIKVDVTECESANKSAEKVLESIRKEVKNDLL